jgi:hypothetical protein
VAGASVFAPVPAAPQSALDPGELRPSVELGQASDPSAGPPSSPGLLGPPLYGTPAESGGGMTGFVTIGNRKVKVRVRPGYTPPGAVPVADRATLRVSPAQLGTTAVRPPSRLKRRGFLIDPPRAVELQRPISLPISSSSRRSCRCART